MNFFFTIREFSHEVEILIVLYVSESFVVVKHYFGQESKVMTSLIDFVVRLDGIDLNETSHALKPSLQYLIHEIKRRKC